MFQWPGDLLFLRESTLSNEMVTIHEVLNSLTQDKTSYKWTPTDQLLAKLLTLL